MKEIIYDQLDINQGKFTKEELDAIQKKIKIRKVAGLDEMRPELWNLYYIYIYSKRWKRQLTRQIEFMQK